MLCYYGKISYNQHHMCTHWIMCYDSCLWCANIEILVHYLSKHLYALSAHNIAHINYELNTLKCPVTKHSYLVDLYNYQHNPVGNFIEHIDSALVILITSTQSGRDF